MNMDLDPHHRFALSAENAVRRSGLTRWLTLASALFLTTLYSPVVSFSQTHDHHTVEVSPAPLTEDVKNELAELTQTLLTQSIQSSVTFNAQSRMSVSAAQSASAADLVAVAEVRQQLLSSIIQEHPEEVLRNTIPADVRATFPSAVQDYLEEEAEQEGELEIIYEMYDNWQKARLHYTLKQDNKELSLHFAAKQPKRLLTGSQVRVKGVQVGEALALESGSTSMQTLAAASSSTIGEQRILVMLVNFQGNSQHQPATVDYVQQGLDQANQFFLENSNKQTWLTSDIFGWHTIPFDGATCDYGRIATLAQQAAAAAGFDLSSYNRYVYSFPGLACGWSGLGTVGGSPSHAWINGGPTRTLLSHELGHNLGLYHSHAYECGSTTLGTNCASYEYSDYLDTMGSGSGHYNAFQKERLGWLPNATHTIQSSGVYELELYETAPGPKPKVLKIQKAPGQWYYVEYRQPIGFDGFLLSNDNVRNGVVIHMGTPSNGNSSHILDMTPETNSWYDPALEVGRSFSDPSTGLAITPLWVNDTGVAVSISLASQPCLHTSPSVSLSPALSPAVQVGTAVTYTVSIINNDGPQCAPSSFTLQANTPTSDWIAPFASPILTLGPGASASTTLRVTSPLSASEGAYTVGIKTSSGAVPGQETLASVTYVVAPPLTAGEMSVSTDKTSYIAREWVKITIRVHKGGAPVHRAKVSSTITKPDGHALKKTIATNKEGEAIFRFQLSNRDPIGTYHVAVHLNQDSDGVSGLATAFAETSFTVR